MFRMSGPVHPSSLCSEPVQTQTSPTARPRNIKNVIAETQDYLVRDRRQSRDTKLPQQPLGTVAASKHPGVWTIEEHLQDTETDGDTSSRHRNHVAGSTRWPKLTKMISRKKFEINRSHGTVSTKKPKLSPKASETASRSGEEPTEGPNVSTTKTNIFRKPLKSSNDGAVTREQDGPPARSLYQELHSARTAVPLSELETNHAEVPGVTEFKDKRPLLSRYCAPTDAACATWKGNTGISNSKRKPGENEFERYWNDDDVPDVILEALTGAHCVQSTAEHTLKDKGSVRTSPLGTAQLVSKAPKPEKVSHPFFPVYQQGQHRTSGVEELLKPGKGEETASKFQIGTNTLFRSHYLGCFSHRAKASDSKD